MKKREMMRKKWEESWEKRGKMKRKKNEEKWRS
jgi:hypothetical protein